MMLANFGIKLEEAEKIRLNELNHSLKGVLDPEEKKKVLYSLTA
jgi:hypothetical protein